MANPYANVQAAPETDGLTYCQNHPLPAAEADLWDPATGLDQYDPVPVRYGAAAFAIVQLAPNVLVSSHQSYVVMQTDQNDNVWVDLAWLNYAGLTAAVFALSAGVAGSNSVQQTRALGAAPTPALGSNQLPLGGRVRFIGKGVLGAGSSSSAAAKPSPRASSSALAAPGQVAAVLCTIKLKLLGLR